MLKKYWVTLYSRLKYRIRCSLVKDGHPGGAYDFDMRPTFKIKSGEID